MKLFLLALVSIGVFLLYQSTVGRTKDNFNLCISTASTAKAEMISDSCKKKMSIYEELSSCVVTVQKMSSISSLLYAPLGIKSTVDILISAHNEECPSEKVRIPGEGMYL